MIISKTPIDFVPPGSKLIFIKQTILADFSKGKKIYAKAIYKCDCGVEREFMISNVKCGYSKSCGCILSGKTIERNTVHGLYKHPLYTVWHNMIARCEDKNNRAYPRYGGRGVNICKEWLDSFKCFYDWAINNGWKKGLQLDKDIKALKMGVQSLLYSPEWCIFTTSKRNSNARSSNKFITWNGKTQTSTQWATELKLKSGTICSRLKYGWSIERSLTTPHKKINKI